LYSPGHILQISSAMHSNFKVLIMPICFTIITLTVILKYEPTSPRSTTDENSKVTHCLSIRNATIAKKKREEKVSMHIYYTTKLF